MGSGQSRGRPDPTRHGTARLVSSRLVSSRLVSSRLGSVRRRAGPGRQGGRKHLASRRAGVASPPSDDALFTCYRHSKLAASSLLVAPVFSIACFG
jgi:hypothetical protein